ncbi:hypothetical protein ACF08N_08000 [Streptomyces sp. NPDC015127]|uniref:hypothetical protein n=1 Tax=Streptomyces sp. NPDC015127 TaxID=3364939 RepID=UPI0036FCD1A4
MRLELRAPDGTRRSLDTGHVVAATGYAPDLGRLRLLDDAPRGGSSRACADACAPLAPPPGAPASTTGVTRPALDR